MGRAPHLVRVDLQVASPHARQSGTCPLRERTRSSAAHAPGRARRACMAAIYRASSLAAASAGCCRRHLPGAAYAAAAPAVWRCRLRPAGTWLRRYLRTCLGSVCQALRMYGGSLPPPAPSPGLARCGAVDGRRSVALLAQFAPRCCAACSLLLGRGAGRVTADAVCRGLPSSRQAKACRLVGWLAHHRPGEKHQQQKYSRGPPAKADVAKHPLHTPPRSGGGGRTAQTPVCRMKAAQKSIHYFIQYSLN